MPTEDDLRVAELRLVEAQLHSDVPALDALIEGSARFTDPTGALWTKAVAPSLGRDHLAGNAAVSEPRTPT